MTRALAAAVAVGLLGATWMAFAEPLETWQQPGPKEDAWRIGPTRWPTDKAEGLQVPWRLHRGGTVQASEEAVLDMAAVRGVLEASADAWNEPAASQLLMFDKRNGAALSQCDYQNVLTWADKATAKHTFAVTSTWSYVGPDKGRLDDKLRASLSVCGKQGLPKDRFPDGMLIRSGMMVDADIAFNPAEYYTLKETNGKVYIGALAAHEFGHLLGLTHAGMPSEKWSVLTMHPKFNQMNARWQANMASPESSDVAALQVLYGHVNQARTGAIAGRVTVDGRPAPGVRVWIYDADSNTDIPVREVFTAGPADLHRKIGQYRVDGLFPGRYNVCVVPWRNKAPAAEFDRPAHYNCTARLGAAYTIKDLSPTCFQRRVYGDQFVPSPSTQVNSADPPLQEVLVQANRVTRRIDLYGSKNGGRLLVAIDPALGGIPTSASRLDIVGPMRQFFDYLAMSAHMKVGLVAHSAGGPTLEPFRTLDNDHRRALLRATAESRSLDFGQPAETFAHGIVEAFDAAENGGEVDRRVVLLLGADATWTDLASEEARARLLHNDIQVYGIGVGPRAPDVSLYRLSAWTGGAHRANVGGGTPQMYHDLLQVGAALSDQASVLAVQQELSAPTEYPFDLSSYDHAITVAASWDLAEPVVGLSLRSPSGCTSRLEPPSPRGSHQLVHKVSLPLQCGGAEHHTGRWAVVATLAEDVPSAQLQLDVYSDSFVDVQFNDPGETAAVYAVGPDDVSLGEGSVEVLGEPLDMSVSVPSGEWPGIDKLDTSAWPGTYRVGGSFDVHVGEEQTTRFVEQAYYRDVVGRAVLAKRAKRAKPCDRPQSSVSPN